MNFSGWRFKLLKLYKKHLLPISKITNEGIYVDGLKYGDIILSEAPKEPKIGAMIEVFLYKSTSEDIVATVELPVSQINECAFLKVVATGDNGTYLDWGFQKDLLLPHSEQSQPTYVDSYAAVYIFEDKKGRPMATTIFHHYLDENAQDLSVGDSVNLMILENSDLGFKASVNNKQLGLIYHSELAQPLQIGTKMNGWVKKIREDGKIDLNVNALDKKARGILEDSIISKLKESKGKIYLSDKSDAKEIYDTFEVSKKNFKRAIGNLYKKRIIKIHPTFIELI